jgi:hypothetical protein
MKISLSRLSWYNSTWYGYFSRPSVISTPGATGVYILQIHPFFLP